MNQNVKHVFNKYLQKKIRYGKEISENLILIDNDKLILDPNQDVLFRLKVKEELCNILESMHGGAVVTVIDIATTIAISGLDRDLRGNVSVDLSTQFLNPIKMNSNILIHCKIPKIGKSIAYSYANIYDEESRKLLATGSHIKSMIEKIEFSYRI